MAPYEGEKFYHAAAEKSRGNHRFFQKSLIAHYLKKS